MNLEFILSSSYSNVVSEISFIESLLRLIHKKQLKNSKYTLTGQYQLKLRIKMI